MQTKEKEFDLGFARILRKEDGLYVADKDADYLLERFLATFLV
jgi:hypothetical protein